MTTHSATIGCQSFLVVFDFDNTIVDCNTDIVVPEFLNRDKFRRLLSEAKNEVQWTKLVDMAVAAFSREQLEDAVTKSVTMDEDMPDVFRFLIQTRQQQEEEPYASASNTAPAPIEIAVASDANILFIEKSIQHHIPFARHAISSIHSNSFQDVADNTEGRRCRVSWYETEGHDCTCCNRKCPNMCKSRILARLLHTTRLVDPTIIFVGDGANDFCPVLNLLRPRDYMLARRGFPIHKLLSDKHDVVGGCCKIRLWSNAKELLHIFQHLMSPAECLPTLARFRDVGPLEFRSVTLLQRMPQVLTRTLQSNEGVITAAARQLISDLVEATRNNAAVAPLPGQKTLPPWLQGYASVLEFDARDVPTPPSQQRNEHTALVAPRWGQLPWLHGEIYFYHLLAQYLLLEEGSGGDDMRAPTTKWAPNFVTPYATCTPIATRDCSIAMDAVVTANGATAHQSFNPSFLARDGSTFAADGILVEGGAKNYRDIAACDSTVPLHGYFQPYRDFFFSEKREVLHQFMKIKICPMLACIPWEADDTFVGVLLRWMLWGNGVDLSMFTLEQLQRSHNVGQEGNLNLDGAFSGSANRSNPILDLDVSALRAAEFRAVMGQDGFILGNQVDDVAQLVCRIVREEPKDSATSRSINIVMDNVGVECVADLIFALWVFHHHPSLRVTLHVKSMPYYVSDVTPPDVTFLLEELEKYAQPGVSSAMALLSFVRLVREALNSGRLRLDADVVWTQPCEYRELPPRVCNTFFYTRRVLSEGELQQQQQPQQESSSFSYPYAAHERHTARSLLVIFKGDLNFRRLIGDRHWDRRAFLSTLSPEQRDALAMSNLLFANTPHLGNRRHDEKQKTKEDETIGFYKIVSAFWPVHVVPVCAIRTIKSELTVGVTAAVQNALDRSDSAWTKSGKYGVILLAAGI